VIVSAPPAPFKILAASLPVMTLARALPVPLIAAVSVKIRFSTLLPRVKLTELLTVSIPPAAASVTVSLAPTK
jgi:hypothetical protein